MKSRQDSPKARYLLRLPLTLKIDAEAAAKAEGTTLNQLIAVALADRVARIEERQTAQKSSVKHGRQKS